MLEETAQSAKVAVVVASLGRADAVGHLLERLELQSVRPHVVVLSLECAEDCPELDQFSLPLEVVYGPRGSSAQRNRALDRLPLEVDFVAIVDDDYVPSRFFIEGVERSFQFFPKASGLGGVLLADGALNNGISFDIAVKLIDEYEKEVSLDGVPCEIPGMLGVYGCNMAFRRSHIGDMRFDEGVPLYGWLEDSDFGARLPGAFLYTDGFFGVHCAVKSGRETRGTRLGYSQVANPIYFWRKGTLTTRRMFSLIARPFFSNCVRLFNPEPWVDRRGRLQGNFIAFSDLFRGNLSPARILQI